MKGVLLVNLGSPESPTAKDVKPYLDEFLMDRFVIDVPYLLRALLVRGVILQTRPKKSAKAYAKVWTPEGSPLIVISKKMHQKGVKFSQEGWEEIQDFHAKVNLNFNLAISAFADRSGELARKVLRNVKNLELYGFAQPKFQ